MSKYQVGDEVEMSFIGKIYRVEVIDGEVRYYIDNGDVANGTYGARVKESYIYPLPVDNTKVR